MSDSDNANDDGDQSAEEVAIAASKATRVISILENKFVEQNVAALFKLRRNQFWRLNRTKK